MEFPAGNQTGVNPEVQGMAEAVIVAGARTPIGKLSGGLASFSAMDLGGFAIAEALSGLALPRTRSTTSSWAR